MSGKSKVLVFATNIVWQREFRERLEPLGILVFSVYTPGSARSKLTENSDIDIIIIVPSISENIDEINDFLKDAYSVYNGVVVGVSDKAAIRRRLLMAGCRHVCDEQGLVQLVKEKAFL